jgi:O-antigen/teichoic acid export membrane protein
MIVSAAGVASITLVGIAVALLGGPLLRITYGPEFSRYWPAAELFAVAFLISSIGLGPILILKTTRNTRSLFRVQLITLVVSFAAVSVLAVLDGVTGAAAAAIVSSTANVIFLTHYGRSARKRLVNSEEESSGQDNSDAIR